MSELFPGPPEPLTAGAGRDPFPVHLLPESMVAILRSVAADFGVPIELTVGPFLSILSVAQGRSVVRIGATYAEPGQLWCISSASAGARKSPILKAARSPLIEIQEELMRGYLIEERMAQSKLKALQECVDKGQKQLNELLSRGAVTVTEAEDPSGSPAPAPVTVDLVEAALREAITRLEEFKESIPPAPKLWFDDPTSEALHDIIAAHPHVGVVIPEGQKILRKLREGKLELAPLLSAYSMETTSRELVSREVKTAHEPSMALLMMVQTAFLREALTDPLLLEAGFTDRPWYTVTPRYRVKPSESCRLDQLNSTGLHNSTEADRRWRRIIRWEVQRTLGLSDPLTFSLADDDALKTFQAEEALWLAAVNNHTYRRATALYKLCGQALRLAKTFAQLRLDSPDFASAVESIPDKLDPATRYPIHAEDITAGFALAWHSFLTIESLLSDEADTDARDEEVALEVLALVRRLSDQNPDYDYLLTPRMVARGTACRDMAEIGRVLARLVETNWAVAVSSPDRRRGQQILVRPDFPRWLSEYGYLPQDPSRAA